MSGHLLDPLWESTQEEDFISLDEDNAVVRSAPPSSFSPFSLAGSHQDGLARWFAEVGSQNSDMHPMHSL